MPNWVTNNVSVTAESKTELDAFLEKAKGEQSKIRNEGNEDFHFGAFVHPPDENLPYYKGEIKEEKPKGWDELSAEEKMSFTLAFSGRDWYDWNVTNWGTKWDAHSPYVHRTGEITATISFETAWSIPEPIFTAIAEQHPELTFEFWSEEEQGWGTEYHAKDGKLVLNTKWDIPDCHADYVRRDNEEGCICSYEDDQDEWYSDCPRPQKFFVRVTKVYELSATTIEEARVEYFQMESGTTPFPEEVSDYGSVDYVDEEGEPVA
jgi:hypothetical protein